MEEFVECCCRDCPYKKNKVFYVLTTSLKSDTPISNWLLKHGDGVYDVAFSVDSVETAYKDCLERGGESALDVVIINDRNGSFSKASIAFGLGPKADSFADNLIGLSIFLN